MGYVEGDGRSPDLRLHRLHGVELSLMGRERKGHGGGDGGEAEEAEVIGYRQSLA